MATYRDWVPGRGTTEFKKIRPTTVKDPQTGTNITTYPIDLPDDKEWPEGATDPPNRTKTRVLPAKCFQLSIDLTIEDPPLTGESNSAETFVLISIGCGNWIPGDSNKKWRGRYETEYFRAIACVTCELNYLNTEEFGYGWLDGVDYGYVGSSDPNISDFYIVKYNDSLEFNNNVYNRLYPYRGEDSQLVAGRWGYDYNEIIAKIEYSSDFSGWGSTYTPLTSKHLFGSDEAGPFDVVFVRTPPVSAEYFRSVTKLIFDAQSGLYEYETLPSRNITYSIPEDAELRVELLDNVGLGVESGIGILTVKDWYIRTLMGSQVYLYRHCAIDDVLGYDLISYTDKKKNLALSFSKDDKKWHSKIVIPANDPGIGIHPSIAVKDSGNIDYYWQKSGKAENATLGSEDVPPISGTGIAGVGIWSMRLNYIHDGDSGPISISNDAAGNRKENQIVAGGYNPVVVEDNQLGLDYLLYWSKSREDKDRIVTGSTGNAVPATITLGSIYAAIAKDGDFDAQPPVLILPHPNDPETAIPQQTVGAACKGNGDILLSWVDKDGTSYQQTVKVFEADAVVT